MAPPSKLDSKAASYVVQDEKEEEEEAEEEEKGTLIVPFTSKSTYWHVNTVTIFMDIAALPSPTS